MEDPGLWLQIIETHLNTHKEQRRACIVHITWNSRSGAGFRCESRHSKKETLTFLPLPCRSVALLCVCEAHSPRKAGFLQTMAAGNPHLIRSPSLQDSPAIMTVFTLGAVGRAAPRSPGAGPVSFCRKTKNFLRSLGADFPAGLVVNSCVTWIP